MGKRNSTTGKTPVIKMAYLPKRIMVPLAPDASKVLGTLAEKNDEHPKRIAASLLRQGLGLGPMCLACDSETFAKDGVWYYRECGLKVALED